MAVVVGVALIVTAAACSRGSEKATGPATVLDATSLERSADPVPSPGCSPAIPPPEAPTTGTLVDHPVTEAGLAGHVLQYLPTSYTGQSPVPLVVDLHGLTVPLQIEPQYSGFPAVAEANGFAYVATAVDADIPWWDAEPAPSVRDDIGFLRGVIAQQGATLCIDMSRVYVSGMSNGAMMASAAGCAMADVVAAIAPVAGLRFPPGCDPSRPVPVISFHGTDDQFIEFETGAAGSGVASLKLPPEVSSLMANYEPIGIDESARRWAEAESCAEPPAESDVASDVKLLRYDGCARSSAVELYVVEGGGHAWPGSTFSASVDSVAGHTTMNIAASELIWQFFSQYRLPPS